MPSLLVKFKYLSFLMQKKLEHLSLVSRNLSAFSTKFLVENAELFLDYKFWKK